MSGGGCDACALARRAARLSYPSDRIDGTDVTVILACVGQPMNPECQRADINRDGTVSSIDVELATMSWRGNFLQSCRQQGGAGGGGSPSIGTPPSGSSRDAGRDTRSGRATAGSQPGEFESCLPCTIKSRADFNGDHIIDGVDLAALLACADDAGQDIASCLSKDLSGDGVIDEVDAGLLQAAWGSLCNSGCR